MHIPRVWSSTSADETLPNGKAIRVTAWGFGEDESTARRIGSERLQRILERLRRGEPFPDKYAYGTRPLREEILQSIDGPTRGEAAAIVTRNAYGAQVLNAARLLFLDVDVAPAGVGERLRGLFGGAAKKQDKALDALRESLRSHGGATFRLYRTASGFRAMAVDREFDPTGSDAQELMKATGTDPAFANLCMAQRSFRARLTPKPWRCNLSVPPGQYPRHDAGLEQRFAGWLEEYERVSDRHATCSYVETIGSGNPSGAMGRLIDLHDRVTRCEESLPLA